MPIVSAVQACTNCFFLQLNLKEPGPGNSATRLASPRGQSRGEAGWKRSLPPGMYTQDRWPQLMIIPSLESLRLESQTLSVTCLRGDSWFRSGPHALSQSKAVGRAGTPAGPGFTGLRWSGAGGPGRPLGMCTQRGQGTHQGGCQGVTGQVGGREVSVFLHAGQPRGALCEGWGCSLAGIGMPVAQAVLGWPGSR